MLKSWKRLYENQSLSADTIFRVEEEIDGLLKKVKKKRLREQKRKFQEEIEEPDSEKVSHI